MKVGKSGPFTEHRLLPNGEWETVKVHESLEAATEALREETRKFLIDNRMKEYDSFEEYWEAVRTALLELGFSQDPDKDTVRDDWENNVMATDSAKAFAETWAD